MEKEWELLAIDLYKILNGLKNLDERKIGVTINLFEEKFEKLTEKVCVEEKLTRFQEIMHFFRENKELVGIITILIAALQYILPIVFRMIG